MPAKPRTKVVHLQEKYQLERERAGLKFLAHGASADMTDPAEQAFAQTWKGMKVAYTEAYRKKCAEKKKSKKPPTPEKPLRHHELAPKPPPPPSQRPQELARKPMPLPQQPRQPLRLKETPCHSRHYDDPGPRYRHPNLRPSAATPRRSLSAGRNPCNPGDPNSQPEGYELHAGGNENGQRGPKSPSEAQVERGDQHRDQHGQHDHKASPNNQGNGKQGLGREGADGQDANGNEPGERKSGGGDEGKASG